MPYLAVPKRIYEKFIKILIIYKNLVKDTEVTEFNDGFCIY